MGRGEEERKEERIRAAWPVTLGGERAGVTRDVSASGIYFETDSHYDPGSSIAFEIDIDTPGGAMVLSCRGQIVRTEQRDARVGVAVKILESTLKPGPRSVSVVGPK